MPESELFATLDAVKRRPSARGAIGPVSSNQTKGERLLSQAKESYPYLNQADLAMSYEPGAKNAYGRQLEYWAPGSTGFTWQHGEERRPSNIPLYSSGVQVFNPNLRPIDVLGDYVSHEAVRTDPTLAKLYEQFQKATPPEVLWQRYQTHRELYGEDRSFGDWAEQSGIPELFRGYTFKQWENPERMYTPEQLAILNRVKQYIGIKD